MLLYLNNLSDWRSLVGIRGLGSTRIQSTETAGTAKTSKQVYRNQIGAFGFHSACAKGATPELQPK